MALNVATNVYGGRMTSSPGPMFNAPSELISAVVPDEVATQYFAPMRFANTASNSFTRAPPEPVRPHTPDRRTSTNAFSSRSSQSGHSFPESGRVAPDGALPAAGFGAWSAAEALERPSVMPAPAAAAALPMKSRRESGAFMRNRSWGATAWTFLAQ